MQAEFFGTSFDCPCGRRHTIVPRRSIYADDATTQLAQACGGLTAGRRAIVLMDSRTKVAAGDDVAAAFEAAGWRVTRAHVPDRAGGRSPVCDDITRRGLDPLLGEADLICPAGAGVVNDLGKWIATDRKLIYVTFATAASMNGYTSANIAPTIGGLKRLLEGTAVQIVATSPRVLSAAPRELTTAGLGDVLAKSVSSADWYANHLLFGDYYCQRGVKLIEEIEPLYLKAGSPLGSASALEALYEALLLTGAAMTMAGTSTPASGSEHLFSHYLDMAAGVDGCEHDLHGRQVGVGTILAAELYRRVLAVESPRFSPPAETVDTARWGAAAGEVAAEYAKKLPRLRQARERLSRGGAWDELRAKLAPMLRPPEMIRDCLATAGGAWKAEHIGCSKDRVLEAFARGHEIRSRFTVLDLARLVGVMPISAGEIVEQWM